MSDRYQQLINTPDRADRLQAGRAARSRSTLERYEPGRPVIDGPVLLGRRPAGPRSPPRSPACSPRSAPRCTRRWTTSCAAAAADGRARRRGVQPRGRAGRADVQGARVRRHRDRLERRRCTRRGRSFTRRSGASRRSGRVIVLGTPAGAGRRRPSRRPPSARSRGSRARSARRCAAARPPSSSTSPRGPRTRSSRRCGSCSRPRRRTSPARWSGSAPPVAEVARRSTGSGRSAGRVALVTGASRGIGAAIAEVLARDGAHVVGLDVPAQAAELEAVTGRLGGSSLTLDITDADAPAADRRAPASSTTAASTSSSTTPASPATRRSGG